MRGKNLIQVIKMLDLLSRPQGVTVKEFSDELGVCVRTVSRRLTALQRMGIPLYDDKIPLEREKRWFIDESYVARLPNLTLPNIALTYPEIICLCMLAGEAVVFKGTEVDRHLTTALAKLIHVIPEDTRAELSALKRIFICKTVGTKAYADKNPVIKDLIESIIGGTACRITYHVFYKDEIEEETIGPLHLFEHNGGLYLFAVKNTDKTVRSYAVERIRRITRLSTAVPYPDTFDPDARLNSAFGITHGDPITVTIRFSHAVARYIKERRWAETQTLTDDPDGSVTLTLTTSGRRDIKRWILSHGPDAHILKPDDLKKEIEDDIKKMMGG
ncbi:WYL domain-containing protein [Desulfatiferula olefinivorans]